VVEEISEFEYHSVRLDSHFLSRAETIDDGAAYSLLAIPLRWSAAGCGWASYVTLYHSLSVAGGSHKNVAPLSPRQIFDYIQRISARLLLA